MSDGKEEDAAGAEGKTGIEGNMNRLTLSAEGESSVAEENGVAPGSSLPSTTQGSYGQFDFVDFTQQQQQCSSEGSNQAGPQSPGRMGGHRNSRDAYADFGAADFSADTTAGSLLEAAETANMLPATEVDAGRQAEKAVSENQFAGEETVNAPQDGIQASNYNSLSMCDVIDPAVVKDDEMESKRADRQNILFNVDYSTEEEKSSEGESKAIHSDHILDRRSLNRHREIAMMQILVPDLSPTNPTSQYTLVESLSESHPRQQVYDLGLDDFDDVEIFQPPESSNGEGDESPLEYHRSVGATEAKFRNVVSPGPSARSKAPLKKSVFRYAGKRPRVDDFKISLLQSSSMSSVPKPRTAIPKFKVGDQVSSQYSMDKQWYPAVVKSVMENGQFVVAYDGYNHCEPRRASQLRALKRSSLRKSSKGTSRRMSPSSEKRMKRAIRKAKESSNPNQTHGSSQGISKEEGKGETGHSEAGVTGCAECGALHLPMAADSECESKYCCHCWETFLKASRPKGTFSTCQRCHCDNIPISSHLHLEWCVMCWARNLPRENNSKHSAVDWKDTHAFMHGYIGRRGLRDGSKNHWNYLAISYCYAEFLAIGLQNRDLASDYWSAVEQKDPFNLSVFRVESQFWLSLGEDSRAETALQRGRRAMKACEHMWLGHLPVTSRFLRAFQRLYLIKGGMNSRKRLPLAFRRATYNLASAFKVMLKKLKAKNQSDVEVQDAITEVEKWLAKQPYETKSWSNGGPLRGTLKEALRRKGFFVPGSSEEGFTEDVKLHERICNLANFTIAAQRKFN
mmetsp:Transcript_17501/g.42747  ORF Transcript_17501/g.42747 Transcript_17501/m.42747 type:complete len:795 (-) Transcript_17501:156-2540(-)